MENIFKVVDDSTMDQIDGIHSIEAEPKIAGPIKREINKFNFLVSIILVFMVIVLFDNFYMRVDIRSLQNDVSILESQIDYLERIRK